MITMIALVLVLVVSVAILVPQFVRGLRGEFGPPMSDEYGFLCVCGLEHPDYWQQGPDHREWCARWKATIA